MKTRWLNGADVAAGATLFPIQEETIMVERIQLENGVRIIIERMPSARSVATGIFIKAGSRTETPEEHGISHLIEHMIFKGTNQFSAKEIAVYFDRLGGNINAFTSKDQTCYYVKTLDEHAATAFDVLADMFLDSTFDEEELEKEKRVVIEEIKMYEEMELKKLEKN